MSAERRQARLGNRLTSGGVILRIGVGRDSSTAQPRTRSASGWSVVRNAPYLIDSDVANALRRA